MVDIPSISAVVAAIGVIVGVVLAIMQLRNLVKTRQTDLAIRLYSTYGSKEFVGAWTKIMTAEFKDYNDFVKKYGLPISSEDPVDIANNMVGIFFEGIGVLLHRKLVDIDLVMQLFPVKIVWEKLKPIVEGTRKQFDEPKFYEWFEYLYNEMQKREQTQQ